MRTPVIVKTSIIVGTIAMVAGIIFVAQSNSVVGPQSSFMYSNPQWTVNGFAILIGGMVLLIGGIMVHFIKRNK
ncbi:MAG TPA: hypothetical protein VE593_05110 [Nitrososphaeraceae archaeon]|nr:hypothetical protein [Nitrososphaeraceae archaeon]